MPRSAPIAHTLAAACFALSPISTAAAKQTQSPLLWAIADLASAFQVREEPEVVRVAPGRAHQQTPLAFLRSLYEPYLVGRLTFADAAGRPGAVSQIFDPSLTALWNLYSAKRRHATEPVNADVVYIDVDPICACQDGPISNLQINVRQTDDHNVVGRAEFKLGTQLRFISLKLRLAGQQWRVHDVQGAGEGSSLRELLEFDAGPRAAIPQGSAVTVPFVGCGADGMLGPVSAPVGLPRAVEVDKYLASRLAYYAGPLDFGVFAPRGWHCFEIDGSGGSLDLFVTPQKMDNADSDFSKWNRVAGPVIVLSSRNADGSGRFSVAHVAAMVFPAQSAFVRKVIEEGFDPASTFHFGPYLTDTVRYLGATVAGYETPPDSEGLGTAMGLKRDSQSIRGAVTLQAGSDGALQMRHLAVRLPAESADLADTVIARFARTTPPSR